MELNPFYLINESFTSSGILLICDHASGALPPVAFDKRVENFVIDSEDLRRHIGVDIGAAEVTRYLSDILRCPAILAGYSRLYLDLNRPLGDFTAMRAISDGSVILGNRYLGANERKMRQEALFYPYHDRVASLRRCMAEQGDLRIIFVHSFTPCYKGFERPWNVGILSGVNYKEFAVSFLGKWQELYDFPIGDNEPYSGESTYSYSIHEHAVRHGHLHFGLEIRQDLIATDATAFVWAERIASCI